MANILLINPSYYGSYGNAKTSIVSHIHPTLGLATIAAVAKERGHSVEILDMSWRQYNYEHVRNRILKSKPDIVGITATTPLVNQLRDISVLAKDISKSILVVGGGAHPSALPEETLKESLLDAVLVGEADYSFADLCDGKELHKIRGLYYRDGDKILSTGWREPISCLDDLPLPAFELYDTELYKRTASRLIVKRPPSTMAEFSRGCVFKCDFCASKLTMALGYRKKSPERCAAEVKIMYELGFREFTLADDIFTSDQQWAIAVCEEIIRADVDMVWSCLNGIRVESSVKELFEVMKRAKCYRVSFGFESGNNEVLKSFGKGGKATIEQGHIAVKSARRAGIDTNGWFLLGLSPDTEQTMRETIEYACTLPLDMLKFGITIAFPGTPMFADYMQKGLIKSYEWDDYHMSSERELFTHPNLSCDTITRFSRLAFRRALIFNPAYIIRRIRRGIRTGEFFWDLYYFLKFLTLPSTHNVVPAQYYARDRWPKYDFVKEGLSPSNNMVVKPGGKAKGKPADKTEHSMGKVVPVSY